MFTRMIPSEWKSAKVTPIYKSGDKSDTYQSFFEIEVNIPKATIHRD